jgi:predicted GNAT family N-acyltransferase
VSAYSADWFPTDFRGVFWALMTDSFLNNPVLRGLKLIEPCTEADWAAYFDLRWRILRAPWQQPRGSERDDSDSSSYHLMFRDPDGLAAAVGRFHLNSALEGQVRYMAVADSWRGKGLGGRILQGLEAFASSKAIKEVVLNAREQAVPFYIRYGYRVEGPADTLFGEVRHVRMRKRL